MKKLDIILSFTSPLLSINSALQVALSAEELKQEEDEEYRQLPDPEQFHGEPVSKRGFLYIID
jgi:hypothetical protein